MKKQGLICLCILLSVLMLLMQGCKNSENNDANTGNDSSGAEQSADKKEEDGWILNKNAADILFEDYVVKIAGCRIEGKIVFVKCMFTNNSAEKTSFSEHFGMELYQNGAGLTFCYAGTTAHTMNNQIKPGVSFEVEISYILNDTESDVEIELFGREDSSYTRVDLATETLPIK